MTPREYRVEVFQEATHAIKTLGATRKVRGIHFLEKTNAKDVDYCFCAVVLDGEKHCGSVDDPDSLKSHIARRWPHLKIDQWIQHVDKLGWDNHKGRMVYDI